MFVFTQTVRHRDFFLPITQKGQHGLFDDESHADPPTSAAAGRSAGLLLAALAAVVGLAEQESPAVEHLVLAAGFPHSFVGVVIATLVLLPETLAAVRAARAGPHPDEPQPRVRLGDGQHRAHHSRHRAGLDLAQRTAGARPGPTQLVLLAVTVVISMLTVVPGRATRLQGEVHLVLLAAYVFMAIVP